MSATTSLNATLDTPRRGGEVDIRLQAGSPAIDRANPEYSGTLFDFDGLDRPYDGDEDGIALFDIGAYEHPPPEPEPETEPETEPADGGSAEAEPDDDSKTRGCASAAVAPTGLAGLALLLSVAALRRRYGSLN